ncbi:MAG: STAS domain-containing protein [Pirellulaceae bacterium]
MSSAKTSARTSVVEVGRTSDGFLLAIVGRGTMRESLALHEHVVECLEHESLSLTIDLSRCEYLDSTFLGCLVKLHKRLGGEQFEVVAPGERRELLASMNLDRLLTVTDDPPAEVVSLTTLTAEMLCSEDLGRHSMHCHRELAQVEGPNRAVFQRIAEQLSRELGEQ